MKSLVIAEKPSVARDLAGVLGQFEKKDGYLENGQYVVTWAIGHLVGLADPEDYSPDFKKWVIGTLPILPDKFRLKANSKTIKQFKTIKDLAARSDIGTLVNACDAGREGESIFRNIYRLAGCKKPFTRLWLSETTPAAVIKAFNLLRPGSEYDRLGHAAEARSRADWLIGINATRAFTCRHSVNGALSVGRVQTPTLALIVNREQEINNFVTTPYWELYAEFTKNTGETYIGKWFKYDTDRFNNPDVARTIQGKVQGQPGEVIDMEQKDISEPPPLLFNLNDLQKEANKKYGMAAAETLETAQALYETRKLLTYPRTDSRHMTIEMAGTITNRLNALAAVPEYNSFTEQAQKASLHGKRYVDDSKVTDHTALIPTDKKPNINALTSAERKIYDLVVRRFLAIFFPPALYKQTRVVTRSAGETFLTTGRVEITPGWKQVYTPAEDEAEESKKDKDNESRTTSVPELAKGDRTRVTKTEIQEKKTKPPKRYTEASLLATMEGAGRLLDDAGLKEAMKGHGLGTPATRAAIIERLIFVGYLQRQKKMLLPTPKGITLINLVPEIIKSPEMTGRWEKTLADIEKGTANPGDFMTGITELTRKIVELARGQETAAVNAGNSSGSGNGRESLGKCLLCNREVVEFPKSYGCTGYKEGCKFAIWKEIAGKKISQAQARTLLKNGVTSVLKGFKSKDKKPFEAQLVINKEGKVVFEFGTGAKK